MRVRMSVRKGGACLGENPSVFSLIIHRRLPISFAPSSHLVTIAFLLFFSLSGAVAIVITAVFGLVGIVVLIASCLTSSSARHGAIGVVLLSLYDVLTD